MREGKLASQLVPQRVRELREERRLRQKDLAARLTTLGGVGWSQAKVAKLESGTRTIGIDDVLLLAAALEVSPFSLFATEPVRITNELVVEPYDVWLWARGYKPLPGMDAWAYFTQLPERDKKIVDLEALINNALNFEHARRGGSVDDAQ